MQSGSSSFVTSSQFSTFWFNNTLAMFTAFWWWGIIWWMNNAIGLLAEYFVVIPATIAQFIASIQWAYVTNAGSLTSSRQTNVSGHCRFGSWKLSNPKVPHCSSNSPGTSYSYSIGGASVVFTETPFFNNLIRPVINWWIFDHIVIRN